MKFNELVEWISRTDESMRQRAATSINRALVVRNWLLGSFIVEFEQNGSDRAQYGERLIQHLADTFSSRGHRGFSYRSLQLFKKFYLTYGNILQTVSAESQPIDFQSVAIVQKPSAQLAQGWQTFMNETILSRLEQAFCLSWSHYAFLVQITVGEERQFYELEAAEGKWSVP